MFGFSERRWAVEVSADTVAAAGFNGRRLVAFAEEEIPPGVWERGVITDPALLGERLGKLLKRLGCRRGKVRFVVPNVDAIERILTIPLVPEKKIGLAVQAEVRRQLAVDLEQVYLRWAKVGKSGGHVIFLALVLREALDSYLEALRKGRYTPVYADLQSLAVLRGVKKRDGFFVILGGDGFLAVTGADEGVPFFSYGQMVEGLEAVAAIEQALVTGISSLRARGKAMADSPVYLFGEAATPEITLALRERDYKVTELKPGVPCPANFPLARRAALLGALLA